MTPTDDLELKMSPEFSYWCADLLRLASYLGGSA